MSGAAGAYPQIYASCLEDWTSQTQERDLTGEVLSFITPVQSAHYNRECDIPCSNYAQTELARLAIDAFDNESVLGAKPKVWVQVTRTPRVKKLLANHKKAASLRRPESEPIGGDDNPTLEEDGNNLNEVTESIDE